MLMLTNCGVATQFPWTNTSVLPPTRMRADAGPQNVRAGTPFSLRMPALHEVERAVAAEPPATTPPISTATIVPKPAHSGIPGP